MTPIVARITILGAKLCVHALTYGLARRFRHATPDERVDLLAEAWPKLVSPEDPATPLPPVDDVPVAALAKVADLAAEPDPDFLKAPEPKSDSGASA